MEKVVSFESSKEHYEAGAWIAWCFDARFSGALDAFAKAKGFQNSDITKFAGGAKSLASESVVERGVELNQIELSIGLHKTKKVVLMLHMDCGAFGGSKAFGNDRKAEQDHLISQLNAAEENVKQAFPDLEVEKVIADFDGVYRV